MPFQLQYEDMPNFSYYKKCDNNYQDEMVSLLHLSEKQKYSLRHKIVKFISKHQLSSEQAIPFVLP